MHVDLIEGRQAIAALREAWLAVYRADPEANYFLSFDWLFGSPRGAGQGSFVLAARSAKDDAGYDAFLPIRLNTERDNGLFHNELNLCGNFTSDYTGFICRPEAEDEAIPAFAAMLGRLRWRRLRLLNFAASDRRTRLFLQRFSSEVVDLKHLSTRNPDGTENGVCPYATLSADWDDFLARKVSSNTRQKIRRFLRQVEGSDSFRFTHTTDETFERDLDILIRLWTERWAQNKGQRLGAIQKSLRRMLAHAQETGTLFMPMLWHEDRPLCTLGILVDEEKKAYNFYIGARDEAFKGPPTGLVLHSYAIRHAISRGIGRYDFLRGNEPYKYTFCSDEGRIRSLLISTKSGGNLGGTLDRRCLHYVRRRAAEFHCGGDSAAAMSAYEQVLQADPSDMSARYMQGIVAARMGDTASSCRAFAACLERKPASLKTWVRLGRALVREYRTWNEVSEAYAPLLRRVPDQRKLPSLVGRVLIRLGQVDFAVSVLQAAARRLPDEAAVRSALAEATQVGSHDLPPPTRRSTRAERQPQHLN
ncbi:GNAT family N-acetyltransferase [Palleronia sp. KMU-117]|uniref:GNAT family N-acetyltransferase n=1 Tax=Palleronia sp. KMU-117 TaxID=3434108 RepID=UPI003D75E4C6